MRALRCDIVTPICQAYAPLSLHFLPTRRAPEDEDTNNSQNTGRWANLELRRVQAIPVRPRQRNQCGLMASYPLRTSRSYETSHLSGLATICCREGNTPTACREKRWPKSFSLAYWLRCSRARMMMVSVPIFACAPIERAGPLTLLAVLNFFHISIGTLLASDGDAVAALSSGVQGWVFYYTHESPTAFHDGIAGLQAAVREAADGSLGIERKLEAIVGCAQFFSSDQWRNWLRLHKGL